MLFSPSDHMPPLCLCSADKRKHFKDLEDLETGSKVAFKPWQSAVCIILSQQRKGHWVLPPSTCLAPQPIPDARVLKPFFLLDHCNWSQEGQVMRKGCGGELLHVTSRGQRADSWQSGSGCCVSDISICLWKHPEVP